MKELVWLAGKLVELAAALTVFVVIGVLGVVIGFVLMKACAL